jgi:hypothetical protein
LRAVIAPAQFHDVAAHLAKQPPPFRALGFAYPARC